MEFIMIASAHFMALLSPGPDFFLILQCSLRLSKKYAISLCCGIAAANGFYIFLAIAGLEVLRDNELVSLWLKILGGMYLIYIGVCLVLAPKRNVTDTSNSRPVDKPFLHHESLNTQFLIGCVSALLNPKNGIFYLSLFTVMVSAETPLILRTLYGVWMFMIVLFWDLTVVMLMGSSRVKRTFNHYIFIVEKISGLSLAGFGVVLTLA